MKNRPFHERLGFAIAGIVATLRKEQSFRLQVLAAIAVVGLLFWVKPAPLWWAMIALSIASVLAAELLNTAVETLADHLHPDRHPQIKDLKDCAAGAVLIASVGALCVAVAFVSDLLL